MLAANKPGCKMQIGTTAIVIAGLLLAGCGDGRQGNSTAGAELAATAERESPEAQQCNSWKSAELLPVVRIQQFAEKYLPENIPYKMKQANQLQIASAYHGGKCYLQFALDGTIDGTSYKLAGECEVEDFGVDDAGAKTVKYVKDDSCTRISL